MNRDSKIQDLEETIRNLVNPTNGDDGLYKARLLHKIQTKKVNKIEFKRSSYAIWAILMFFSVLILSPFLFSQKFYTTTNNVFGGIFLAVFGTIIIISILKRSYFKNRLTISNNELKYNEEVIPINDILVAFIHMGVYLYRDDKYFLYLGLEDLQIKVFEVTGLAENGKGLSVVPDNRAKIGHWIEYFKSRDNR